MFSLFYLLVKTTKRDFGNIKHAEIKQVLSFKQVSVTLSNFLNRKNKKQTDIIHYLLLFFVYLLYFPIIKRSKYQY